MNKYTIEYVTAMARHETLDVQADNVPSAIEKVVEKTGVHFSMIRHVEDCGRCIWSK